MNFERGFPLRLKGMKPEGKPKPVNNIADLKKPMWIGLARKPQWRCLIPVTHFAEAEGQKGSKTRTWFNVKGRPDPIVLRFGEDDKRNR